MKIAPAQKQATEEEEKGAKDLAVATTEEAEEETKAPENKNYSDLSGMRHFSPVAACLVLMV